MMMVLTGMLIFSCKKEEHAKTLPVGLASSMLPQGHNDSVFFYRVDTRPPNEIFEQGFQPRGINADLLSHVRGMTAGARYDSLAEPSAFVATTTSIKVVKHLAWAILHDIVRPGESVWIYEVQPDNNSFSVDTSFRLAIEMLLDNDNNDSEVESKTSTSKSSKIDSIRRRINSIRRRAIALFIEYYELYRNQREYVALGGIGREDIRSSRRVTLNPVNERSYHIAAPQYNDHFRLRPNSAPSPEPFIMYSARIDSIDNSDWIDSLRIDSLLDVFRKLNNGNNTTPPPPPPSGWDVASFSAFIPAFIHCCMHTDSRDRGLKRSAIDSKPLTNEEFYLFRRELMNEYESIRGRYFSEMDPNFFERLLFKDLIKPY